MYKKISLGLLLVSLWGLIMVPTLQAENSLIKQQDSGGGDDIFQAEVVKILQEKIIEREDGSQATQQNLKLMGLNGTWTNKEFIFYGIGELDVVAANVYQVGDKVMVNHNQKPNGEDVFYVVDYVRQNKLYWLVLLFALLVIIVGGLKGLKALLSLAVSFWVIMEFILPRILAGNSPLAVAMVGAAIILLLIVYLTEGFNRRAHLSVASIFLSLLCVAGLAIIFTNLTKLTGMAQEETMFLINLGQAAINFKGLFLAGVIIGSLGVLDDVVVSQITAIEEIKKTNPELSRRELFNKGNKIGIAHMSSMANTLFLAYAGAALPLLLLFTVKQPPFLTFNQVINNEMIATEIVRTLTGSIGLVLAIPIATCLAVYFLKPENFIDKK